MTQDTHHPHQRQWQWLAALLLLGIAVRLVCFTGYEMQLFPDSSTYRQAAADLLSGDFSVGLGRRTPGYPLVMAIVGSKTSTIFGLQALVGLGISAMLFAIARLLGGSPRIAFVVGASYSLNLQQLFQEATLLTETMSTFSVVAACLALMVAVRRVRGGQSAVTWLLLTGALAGYSVMVRPQYVVFAAIVPLALLYSSGKWRWPGSRGLGIAATATLPIVLIVLAWCTVVYVKVGYFTMSTQSGFGMVNHPIDYIEKAPAPYEQVRDILIRTRDARIAQVGHSRNTIWYAWPEIQQATGWTLPEASRHFQRMCSRMFADDPLRYAISVAHAWYDFWAVPIFWDPSQIRPTGLGSLLDRAWPLQMWMLRLANLAFVLMVAVVVVWPKARGVVGWGIELTSIAAVVLMSSVVQALADQGASARYAIPTQALVLAVVLMAFWRVWRVHRINPPAGHASVAT